MNLSERVALDGLFPDHPLSQAREFVQAILYDELMEDVENRTAFEDKEVGSKMGTGEKEILLSLFKKGEKCRRHRFLVNIE